jgi:hypothetical protein
MNPEAGTGPLPQAMDADVEDGATEPVRPGLVPRGCDATSGQPWPGGLRRHVPGRPATAPPKKGRIVTRDRPPCGEIPVMRAESEVPEGRSNPASLIGDSFRHGRGGPSGAFDAHPAPSGAVLPRFLPRASKEEWECRSLDLRDGPGVLEKREAGDGDMAACRDTIANAVRDHPAGRVVPADDTCGAGPIVSPVLSETTARMDPQPPEGTDVERQRMAQEARD